MLCPTDLLWIVTNGSVKQNSIGAVMYADRGGKLIICDHFSASLHSHQPRWLPCEVKALAIAVAIRHFSPKLSSQSIILLYMQIASYAHRPMKDSVVASF